ncbi:AhpC/TSA family protein [Mucilaginibacter corticis]|uniref:AhpC/TSA family protein n=1 Tax=Mucilaginibacter corticis TaxID=2597670 RepID=A0A556MXD1_9SPHI|nr:TlpA disulfide reductase family protein [Mucilaginibacter corticis]TSJ44591.1 AhpC/TSA family protein [Mucilaginibacter corticis]
MKRLFIACAFLLCNIAAWAQNAKINITIINGTSPHYALWVHNLLFKSENEKQFYKIDSATNIRTASLSYNLSEPKVISIYYSLANDKDGYQQYYFFLSPGDNINFKADLKKPGNAIEISGKGAANNYPLDLRGVDYEKLYSDSLPNRIIASINAQYQVNKQALANYIAKYKPTALFIKAKTYEAQYMASLNYHQFKENNKYRISEKYGRLQPIWERIQDSLFKTLKPQIISAKKANGKTNALNQPISTINNDDALVSENYKELLQSFMLREKERLWNEYGTNPERFFKQWYDADLITGRKMFQDDMSNLLKEKIINTYFTGRSADFLYATLTQEALHESDPKNLVTIFERYKKLYPKSPYTNEFEAQISEIAKRESKPLTDKMLFVAENGTKLKTFDEVLALTKGKTVLVDMWGTWCGPCREEIEKNSAAIKDHFKGSNLEYLYVANFDSNNEATWKKLIAYFHLEGTHILANDDLNKDIMSKINGNGYPTYFIIKKDGSYELSKAGYPMDRDVLIKQLESAMAE